MGALTAFLRFRAPDGCGVRTKGAVDLWHARAGRSPEPADRPQPSTLDGEVWLTGDLRIDGRAELLKKLGLAGDPTAFEDAGLLDGNLRPVRYWSVRPVAEVGAAPPVDCLERFEELIEMAVRDRMSAPRTGILLKQ